MNLKTLTSILAAGAILAVAAPAGNATGSMIPRGLSPSDQRVVVRDTSGAAAQLRLLKAKNRALAVQNRVLAAEIAALARQVKRMEAWITVLLPPRPVPDGPLCPPDPGPVLMLSIERLCQYPMVPDPELQEECIDYGTCTPEEKCSYWGECASTAGSDTGGESTPASESETSMANELPGFDSSELPEEVTGAVEFDYSVYDWEG